MELLYYCCVVVYAIKLEINEYALHKFDKRQHNLYKDFEISLTFPKDFLKSILLLSCLKN